MRGALRALDGIGERGTRKADSGKEVVKGGKTKLGTDGVDSVCGERGLGDCVGSRICDVFMTVRSWAGCRLAKTDARKSG